MALVAAVLAAVHHAEVVALRVGEPFGAILLALAVTVIELGLIVSIMLGDQPEPTLLRDTIHAVVVLVLHGVAGLCIVVGALRHREQEFRIAGRAGLPDRAAADGGDHAGAAQLHHQRAGARTTRTRSWPSSAWPACCCGWPSPSCRRCATASTSCRARRLPRQRRPRGPSARLTAAALGLLLVALVAVVLLAKGVSPFIQAAVAGLGAPPALVGVIVAAIVLLPEGMTAVRAARDDQLQTSINLALGSGVASIGLTVPTVAAVAWWTGSPMALGVTPGGAVLLTLSFMMALITYGTGRASLLSGVVHLILLATWLFLIVVP